MPDESPPEKVTRLARKRKTSAVANDPPPAPVPKAPGIDLRSAGELQQELAHHVIAAVVSDFAEAGAELVATARGEGATSYLRFVTALLPKEFSTATAADRIPYDELLAALRFIDERRPAPAADLAAEVSSGAGPAPAPGDTAAVQPAQPLSPVPEAG